ncbi:DUF4263 domain-containing protein [Candidatus Nomurabacteria bacterium]|nr:DUF4263 domain-containing protein [Candidatus Nomurabacteria bacterium]
MITYEKGEYLKKDSHSKEVFYFKSEKDDYDVLSREVYKNKALEIHFPFNPKGSQKYKYIESIEFHNISPNNIHGVYKVANFGWGFTKNLSPIIYYLEKFPNIKKIIISPKLKSKINKNNIIFNLLNLEEIFHWIKPLKEGHSLELKKTANNALADIFPEKIKSEIETYTKGSLSVFIKNKGVTKEKLSDDDINSVINVIPDHITQKNLLYKTEEKINFIKLNKTKNDFKKLINQKADTPKLEERCQKFFGENSWIFSNILSTPVAILAGKAYVGGKIFDNKSGREADFLYKNNLTHNVFIVEIKTPKKKLIDSLNAYRKPDVFSIGKELTGGLIQVLDQKDNLQKEFYRISSGKFESFSPKALLVIGNLKDLDKKQFKSFELFRSNIKDVEIVTYDELYERTNLILGQFVEK